jgi:hypothetical protein
VVAAAAAAAVVVVVVVVVVVNIKELQKTAILGTAYILRKVVL